MRELTDAILVDVAGCDITVRFLFSDATDSIQTLAVNQIAYDDPVLVPLLNEDGTPQLSEDGEPITTTQVESKYKDSFTINDKVALSAQLRAYAEAYLLGCEVEESATLDESLREWIGKSLLV